MTTSLKQQPLPDVPVEYAGQWITWNDEQMQILASGSDVAAVRKAACRLGAKQPLLEKVPRLDTHYVGTL